MCEVKLDRRHFILLGRLFQVSAVDVRRMQLLPSSETVVLFLEIQTLWEASMLQDEMGRFTIAV